MAINNIYRVSVEGEQPGGNKLICTFHYRADLPTVLQTQSEDLADAWNDELQILWRNTFSDACTINAIRVRGVTDLTEGYDLSLSPAQPGGLSSDMLPSIVAPVVTWYTGLIGRSNRGRSFLWPITEPHQLQGVIGGALVSAINSFAAAAMFIGDGVTQAQYQLVVWSRKLTVARPVTAFLTRPLTYRQGRRQRGRGA